MGSPLLLTAWILAAGALQPTAPGETAWTAGEAGPEKPWSAPLRFEAGGHLLVELEPTAEGGDLDLAVLRADSPPARAPNHTAEEVLLLELEAGDSITLQVCRAPGAAPRPAPAPFRLGLTLLRPTPGPAPRTLTPAGRRALAVALAHPAELSLSHEGPGSVELLVFDEAERLTERADPRPSPDGLRARAREAGLAVVLAHGEEVTATLRAVRSRGSPGPLEAFLERLGRTPAQRQVLAALRRNRDFLAVRTYLERYPGGLPIRLLVVPGLRAHGIERFGTYSRGTLAINPTIAGHQTNPQELVDTLIHELIHAVLSLPRAPGFPLAADVLDSSHDPRLRGLGGAPLKRGVHPEPHHGYLEQAYGPSASNPDEDYTDINAGAQRLIMKVIRETLDRTGLGRPTLVFENAERRSKLPETK
jgi:hypothetical protein